MAKKTRLTIVGLFLILLAIGIVIGTQSFDLLGQEIYRVNYWSASCDTKADNLRLTNIPSFDDDPVWYDCSTSGSIDIGLDTYVPDYPGVQCEYIISDQGGIQSIDVCNEGVRDKDHASCTHITGGFLNSDTSTQTIAITEGESIFINTITGLGRPNLDVRYPSYGLNIVQTDGFRSQQTPSCFLNTLSSDLHSIDAGDIEEVRPENPFNVVSSLERAITTQAVVLEDVEGGKPIYISRVSAGGGYYWLIEEAEDGFRYVDSSQPEKFSSDIECIPRTNGCSDDAKLELLTEQSCGLFGGTPVGYAPVPGNAREICTYECVDERPVPTDDCVEIPESNCPLGTSWSSIEGACTDLTAPQEPFGIVDVPSWLKNVLIGAGFVLAGIIIFLVIDRMGKKGGRRKR